MYALTVTIFEKEERLRMKLHRRKGLALLLIIVLLFAMVPMTALGGRRTGLLTRLIKPEMS